jgi:peptidyl-prolyl cis-trans isomerase D
LTMLQALRDKSSGWITTVVLGFLALLLGLSGLQGYVVSATDTSAAAVGDAKITPDQFQRAYGEARQRFEQSGQDSASFDTAERRRQTLDQLVEQSLLEQGAADANLVYSMAAVKETIAREATFQKDGKFDNGLFQKFLADSGQTEGQIVQRLIQSHQQNILQGSIGASSLVSDADVDDFLLLRDQTRNFRFLTIDVNDLAAPAVLTDAELKKAYEAQSASYMTTEFADFEYVRVQSALLPKPVASDAALQKKYDEQTTRFKQPERRAASHILIEVDGGVNAQPDKQKAALAIANGLLERARKGEDFAAMARASSKDLGSAGEGGDLGMIEKGVSEPAFDAKLFSMKVGEISDPVLTSQGYHIIKIGEIEAERVKTFAEARADLESEFLAQEADIAFNKLAGSLVDAARAEPRALAAAVKAAGLPSQRTGMMSAIGQLEAGAPSPDSITTKPEFLKAAFSAAVLERGENSDLITLANGDALVLRLSQRKSSVLKPFADVRAQVSAQLTAQRQAQALKDRAAALLKSVNEGKTLDTLATELKKTLETADSAGRNAANRDPVLSAEVFKAARPLAGKPTRLVATLSPDRIALVELTAVKDADPKAADAATRDSVRQQLSYEVAQAEIAGLKASLRVGKSITLHEDRLAQ